MRSFPGSSYRAVDGSGAVQGAAGLLLVAMALVFLQIGSVNAQEATKDDAAAKAGAGSCSWTG